MSTHTHYPHCIYRGVGEVLFIAHPSKQRIVERVPQQEQRLSDPERGLVDAVDADECFHVVQEKNVVENRVEERDGAIVSPEPRFQHRRSYL